MTIIKTLKNMNGEEVFFKGEAVMIDYPYIIRLGEKIKLSHKDWLKLYNEYWDNPSNEGYWIEKGMKLI